MPYRHTIMLVIAAIAASSIIWGAPHADAQVKQVKERYGTRQLAQCADRTKPAKGAPSTTQAQQYLKCHWEKESSGAVYLLEDIKLEVAPKGRAYDRSAYLPEVDTSHPIFDLRGSYLQYQCLGIWSDRSNAGKNCNLYEHPKAKGVCWKTTFGDWTCTMSDLYAVKLVTNGPPPR